MPVFCNISLYKNLSEFFFCYFEHTTYQLLISVVDISLCCTVIDQLYFCICSSQMKSTLMASNTSSTLLPSILTVMTLLGHDSLQQEGLCQQTFMEIMQACGSEVGNSALLAVFWTNQPTGRQIPCIVLSCLNMQEEGWDCVLFSRSSWDSSVSSHLCNTMSLNLPLIWFNWWSFDGF